MRHPFLRTLAGSAAPAATDPNFENVTLLLHGDGTNGGQNNTFVDGSTNNFTITRNGNTTQGTFSPYGDNWSNYFDGTGDDLSLTGQNLSATDWTVECWVYFQSFSNSGPHLWNFGTDINNRYNVWRNSTTGTFSFTRVNGGSYDVKNGTTSPVVGRWYHIAVVRVNSTGVQTLYVDGVAEVTNTGSISTGTTWTIGFVPGGATADRMLGYISNFRVVTSAVYTANFTPPTAPLTAITNTSLLTCSTNRFRDVSSNNRTITRNGDVSVQRFSPFSPTAAYAAGTIGGSGYFDGTGDNLSISSATGLCDFAAGQAFTFQVWLYRLGTGSMLFIQGGANTFQVFVGSSTGGWGYGKAGVADVLTGAGAAPIGAWSHCTICRDTSNRSRIWVNGVSVASSTSDTYSYNTAATYIGSNSASSSSFVQGYLSDMRILKGQALYDPTSSANIEVPTAPLSAVTNTSFLLNFQNAAILDNAMMAVPETVGNAQISTSVKKYGTGSLAFDGNGDRIKILDSPNWDFGTGDFTIEFWFSLNVVPTTDPATRQSFVSHYAVTTPRTGWNCQLGEAPDNKINFGWGDTALVVSAARTWSTGQWYHYAVARAGTSLRLFIDGNQVASATDSTNMTGSPNSCTVGALNVATPPGENFIQQVNGYIDDLRVTKGVARYTSNFTPPTAAFPDL